jgi:hypothetical protein
MDFKGSPYFQMPQGQFQPLQEKMDRREKNLINKIDEAIDFRK